MQAVVVSMSFAWISYIYFAIFDGCVQFTGSYRYSAFDSYAATGRGLSRTAAAQFFRSCQPAVGSTTQKLS